MKKILLTFFIISTALAGKAQNLVPNGDFETHLNCNDGYVDNSPPWINPTGGTPDYLNQCIGGGFGVPDNSFGHQFAHSGDAYCGIILYYQDLSLGLYREYLEVPLTSPLTAGACYHFEMYFNLTEVYSRFTTTDVGVYFSNTLISGVPGHDPLLYTPQIVNPAGNYPDTVSWTLVSGNYTALGGESYLLIGNFKDGLNPDTVLFNSSVFWDESYVFIDDVSLTICTGIEEQTQNEAITIYPNPVKDELFIKSNSLSGKTEVTITDALGKEVYRNQFSNTNFKFQISNFQTGIYFLEINTGTNVIRKKFVKE